MRESKLEVKNTKYREKYRTGMIFRSKRNPWADLVICDVYYNRFVESAKDFNNAAYVCWRRVNWEEFDRYVCIRKGYNYTPGKNGRMDFSNKTTFPFPSFGESKPSSMDIYLRKYELEFAGMSEEEIVVYKDDESEYLSGLQK